MHIPKTKQIQGLRKALANRKTPKQFLPSLRKRLAKLTAAFILSVFGATLVSAQTPVTIQPYQQTLAAVGTACTGSTQTFTTDNRNLTQHFVTITQTAPVTSLQAVILGVDLGGNTVQISDTGYYTFAGGPAVLVGSGYYPYIRVQVICTGGTFGVDYSGSAATSPLNAGTQLETQIFKPLASSQAANAGFTTTLMTPFGSSAGILLFNYGATGPGGSTIGITCAPGAGIALIPAIQSTALATTTGQQQFYVPPLPCYALTISYSSGGASAALFSMSYSFVAPGTLNPTQGLYAHITGTTATSVRSGGGTFGGINLNTSGAGTISVFDLASVSCTGTPSTNTIAVLTIAATENARSIPFNVAVQNGLCIKASAAMDITVGYQ
jgi:hypothetical protein